MENMETKGKFIVFEGVDGSGKSTQMKLLGKYLKEKGVPVFGTREPTDSPFGALLRSCLTGRIDADEYTVAALFAADRQDHIRNGVNGILAKLREGVAVLCDRFYLSSLAYNGAMVPAEWVEELNRPAIEETIPDLTFFIDVSIEESMERVSGRGSVERYETAERQRAIRARYFELFERFGKTQRIEIVKSEEDKTLTQAHIRAIADGLFGF